MIFYIEKNYVFNEFFFYNSVTEQNKNDFYKNH